MGSQGKKKGLIIVNTGHGKGKTSSALGVTLRALGYDFKVSIIQFAKGSWKTGEERIAKKLGPNYEIISMGLGFTWLSKDIKKDEQKAKEAWRLGHEKIMSGAYQIVVLDEITYAINYGFISIKDVLHTLNNKPTLLHVIITGRDAPKELIEIADLVTEMTLVKHPYQKGVMAQRGIEF